MRAALGLRTAPDAKIKDLKAMVVVFAAAVGAACAGSPASQPGHGKVSFRQRAADEAAAAAAAGSSAAAAPQPPAHVTVGGLGKIHPHATTTPSKQQRPADSGAEDEQQQAAEADEAAAAAAAASGRSLGPSQAAAAAAAGAAAGDAPRVRGSGPQLDMMTGVCVCVMLSSLQGWQQQQQCFGGIARLAGPALC